MKKGEASFRKAAFIFILILAALASPSAEKNPPATVYSTAGEDGFLVASAKNWYLEEFDLLGRPVSGTLWKDGAIAERTSWLYVDETQQAVKKITTGASGSVETDFGVSGNVIASISFDAAGKTVETVRNKYDADGNLVLSEKTVGDTVDRTETDYAAGERTGKRAFRNGVLLASWKWTDGDDWTETVYRDGSPILVMEYVDGARKDTKK